jgi:TolB-like protein/Tfp pilus assembly protein PilF
MADSKPEAATGASIRSAENRLDSWKEIAAHLKRDERTVRRWEKAEGLPVHRHVHKRQATVYAYKSELDGWRNNRRPLLEQREQVQGAVRRRWRELLAALLAVSVLALAAAKLRDWRLRVRGPSDSLVIRSVAVLPLENLSGDPEQEYFADGVTEDLIADLAQISALRVISRTSVMQYKRAKKPLPQIARELKVDAVVEGVIERSGDRVRITAQLIYAPADRHLWAKRYERELRGVLALQDEVARDIADEIQVKLDPEEQVRLASSHPVNPAAYDAYLKGRFFYTKMTTEGYEKGLKTFQRAVAIDPEFALGYAWLAKSYMQLGNSSMQPTRETYPKAKTAARRSLGIDDTLAEPHLSLAWIDDSYEYDQSGAEKEFRRAIELNPSLADAHGDYSLYLVHMVRCEEAKAEARMAQRLDPLSVGVKTLLGITFWCARQYDQANQQLQDVLGLYPDDPLARYWLAEVYLAEGKYQEAMAQARQLEAHGDLPQTDTRYLLGMAYALAGRRSEAVKIIEGLKHNRAQGYARPQMIAAIYGALGEKDEVIRWIEKGCEEHDDWVVWSRVYPALGFQSLRSDPRYQALLRRIGLPP